MIIIVIFKPYIKDRASDMPTYAIRENVFIGLP